MTNFKFYRLKDFIHKQQPYLSNWCWAACLSTIIDGLNTETNIGKKQCNLASFYRQYRANTQINATSYSECCPFSQNISDECNQAIADSHISDIYSHSGIEASLEDENYINDYQWVKNTLINNQAPILVKYTVNGQGHANLVTGYGEINNCQYLLLSDPQYEYSDEYKLISIVKLLEIEKIWALKKLKKNKLEKDFEIYDRFDKALKYTKSLNKKNLDVNTAKELKNPLNYLGYKNPAIIDSLLENTVKSEIFEGLNLRNLVNDFKAQKTNGVCLRKIIKEMAHLIRLIEALGAAAISVALQGALENINPKSTEKLRQT